jgi:DNA primase
VARYTDESRERVREAVDFEELVGARTELRRAGARRLQGLCPFHDERTPSFGIDPVDKLYYCFGCGAGGDVFKFVMETEGLDFAGALESLADRFGVELEREYEDPRAAERREHQARLFGLLERTAAYYVRVLWESGEAQDARTYLLGRGLGEAALREFRIGYAPSAWDRVLMASRRAGFSEAELLAAGLLSRGRGGGVYDRFRARIMFPLADEKGRVRGFGARALRESQQPKYLNSSEGDLFHKGTFVYAHDLARAAAAKAGAVVLTEGYTDVIALHQAGIRNAVGLMGTALTAEQATKLRQLAPSVLLCLDADRAGREAMMRAASLVGGGGGGAGLRVVPLPAGRDPADLVAAEGAEAMQALLGRAVPFARFEVERALEAGDLSSAEGRDQVLGVVAPVIRPLPAGIVRDELVRLVADRLGMGESLVNETLSGEGRAMRAAEGAPAARRGGWAGIGGGGGAGRGGPGGAGAGRGLPVDHQEKTERLFLARCLAVTGAGRTALEAADIDELFVSELTRRAARYLVAHLEHPGEDLPTGDDALARLIAELVIRTGDLDSDPEALELERLQLEKLRLDRRIADARRSGETVGELAAERQRVHDAIRHRLV